MLVQVGDFWLQDCTWRGFAPEHAGVMCSAVHAGLPVVVVDGNHEVWPCLSEFRQRDDIAAARAAGRPLHLGGSLWRADRRSTWSWAAMRFGALGGSASPDRWMPRVASHRWEQETTTREDLERLLGNAAGGLDVLICHDAAGGLDVLICHDAPEGTTGLVSGLPWEMPPYLQHEADTVQALLQSAVDETQPAVVFHGHWHQKNRCRLNARSGCRARSRRKLPECGPAVDQRPANPIRGPVSALAPVLRKSPRRHSPAGGGGGSLPPLTRVAPGTVWCECSRRLRLNHFTISPEGMSLSEVDGTRPRWAATPSGPSM